MPPCPPCCLPRRSGFLAVAALQVLTLAQPALANTYDWGNVAGGSASTPSNWSPAGIPRAGDQVRWSAAISPPGAYNMYWAMPADSVPVDTVFQMTVDYGRPRFYIGTVVGVASTLIVDTDSMTLINGTLRSSRMAVGSGGRGILLMSGTATQLLCADSTSATTIGATGTGHVTVLGGAKFKCNGWLQMGFTHTDSCSLTVIGGNFFQHIFSGMSTLGTAGNEVRRGDVTVGDTGVAVLQVSNGGFVTVAGKLFVGRHSTGNGSVHVYNPPNGAGTPSLTVAGKTYVSATDDSAKALSGTGSILIERGFASFNDSTYIGRGDKAGTMTVRNSASLGMTHVALISPGTVGYSQLLVRGATTNIGNSLDVGLGNSAQDGLCLAQVDSNGVMNYNSVTTPLSVAWDGELDVFHGATLVSPTEDIKVVGPLFNTSVVQAPRVHAAVDFLGNPGTVNLAGTLRARVLLDAATQLLCYKPNGVPVLCLAGDSTVTDGYVSNGLTSVGDDTLMILDQDLADLGNLWLGSGGAGGVLDLPHGGKIAASDSLRGFGTVNGNLVNEGALRLVSANLTVNGHLTQLAGRTNGSGTLIMGPNDSLTARGGIAPALTVAGPLDLGPAPSLLSVGPLTMSAAASTRIRLGLKASGIQDTLLSSGAVNLGGVLDLRSVIGNPPASGDTFTIITGSIVNGAFSSVLLDGQAAAGNATVIYGPSRVKVAVIRSPTSVPPGGDARPARVLRLVPAGTVADPAFALDLPEASRVKLAVYDAAGRRLSDLQNGPLASGRYLFRLGSRAPSGAYFGRAEVRSESGVIRTLLARVVRVR